jgi:hypothetical protein
MPSFQSLFWVLFLLTFAQAAYAGPYCSSQWGRIKVGLVSGLPFTADIAFTEWELSPDGTRKQRNTGITFVAHTARDTAGKVVFRMSFEDSQGRSHQGGVSTICNPEDQSTTSMSNMAVQIDKCHGSIPGLMRFHGSAFQMPAIPPKIPVENLGTKDFNGIQTSGFRYPRENAPKSMMTEAWLSEFMELEMLHIETDPLNASETRAAVLNLHRQEPPPELFQIPTEMKDKVTIRPCPTTTSP